MAIDFAARVGKHVTLGESAQIGAFAVVGDDHGLTTYVDAGAVIGSFCLIEADVRLGLRVQVDAYCRICRGTVVGDDSRILYGAQVFEDVRIGSRCIIGGSLADRVIVEDNVTYFGETAHAYRLPGSLENWDSTEQPSAIIRSRSVVGQNALLVGGISVGPGAYISAGEIVRCDVPPNTVFWRGAILPLADFRGFVSVRSES